MNCWKRLKNFRYASKRMNIKVLVMDVDGTLTDGSINIGNEGEIFKRFYCCDGLAILEMQKKGIEPIILTSRESRIVDIRCRELGIRQVYQGFVSNKAEQLKNIKEKMNLQQENIAYIGDDVNDLQCMKLCGLVACPANAERRIKKISDFVCKRRGGEGAVREFVDWIIEGKS